MPHPIRLGKALATCGVTSRRKAEELIMQGKVTVNGKLVFLPQTLVEVGKDKIEVGGTVLREVQEKKYFILNKPKNYICSSKEVGSKKLVIDLFAPYGLRVFTVGRLDRDTTGLLIVTNDGEFAQSIIHPSKGLQKEYLVKVKQEVEHDHLVAISEGVRIEGVLVRPKKVVKVRRGTVKITVMEGKKREVRLLVQKAGLDLISLKRIRIGNLHLGALEEGEFREMSERELQIIFE